MPTYIKCTECGILLNKNGSFKEIGILNGNNCPNCGGEIILIEDNF